MEPFKDVLNRPASVQLISRPKQLGKSRFFCLHRQKPIDAKMVYSGCIGHELMNLEEYTTLSTLGDVDYIFFKYEIHAADTLVVTTDAAYSKGEKGACKVVVIRDGQLRYLHGETVNDVRAVRPREDSNHIAEADAVTFGLQKAKKLLKDSKGKYTKIALYTDSKLAVDGFNNGTTENPHFEGNIPLYRINMMRRAAELLLWAEEGKLAGEEVDPLEVPEVTVTHVYRELNCAADALAAQRKTKFWFVSQLPGPIVKIIEDDGLVSRYR